MATTNTTPAAPAAPTPTAKAKPEPTVSSDDQRLYEYTQKDAPEDVVINVGTNSVMVAAPHAVNDPQRIEVGDRRRGAYYLGMLGKLPGLMRLRDVDGNRLAAVNKIRDIRVGKREEDWIVNAREQAAKKGGPQPLPFNPLAPESPLTRAARSL